MVEFKQFTVPVVFVIVMNLALNLVEMDDGLGKLCTYFIIAILPVLIIQLNNVKKQKIDVSIMMFVGLLISYTFITLTFSTIILIIFNKL